MIKIIFTCKTVTPLVMNGASGQNPELRPPGIKAALRFWWRALHGHLPLEDFKNPDDPVQKKGLRTLEGDIFGNTAKRSNVLIRRIENHLPATLIRTSLLPHKGGSEADAFKSDQLFQIRFDFNPDTISKEKIKNLFILTCALGGWGKRSRRGFGSVTVTEIDGASVASPDTLEDIMGFLDNIVPSRFSINSAGELKSNLTSGKKRNEEYPWLLEVQIGGSVKTTKDIGQATHDIMSEHEPQKLNYKYVLGAGSLRFASPIIVSTLANGKPIISTMASFGHPISKKDAERGATLTPSLQTDLKNEIL